MVASSNGYVSWEAGSTFWYPPYRNPKPMEYVVRNWSPEGGFFDAVYFSAGPHHHDWLIGIAKELLLPHGHSPMDGRGIENKLIKILEARKEEALAFTPAYELTLEELDRLDSIELVRPGREIMSYLASRSNNIVVMHPQWYTPPSIWTLRN